MTGRDPAVRLRGYQSKTDALRLIAEHGSLDALITATLGTEPKHPALAQRGDLLLFIVDEGEDPGSHGIGVCDGVKSWVPTLVGLTIRPTLSALKAWSVE
jgi:hypothetical protein